MNGRGPRLSEALLAALGIGFAAAAFILAFVGRPTWGARIAATCLILLAVGLVAVWHWGFRAGARWARSNADPPNQMPPPSSG